MVRVVNADDAHWRYVALCTHVDAEDPELAQAAETRLSWLRSRARTEGLVTKVAVNDDGTPLGFLHAVPIASPLSQMRGHGFMVIPCLSINYRLVYDQVHGTGVGRRLVHACEDTAKRGGFHGLAAYAFTNEFWFMPSAFFQHVGFTRVSDTSDIWVKTWDAVDPPTPQQRRYAYTPVPGKVVLDYFWSPFCLTVCGEIRNIRAVVAEFGDAVVLREHRSDDPAIYEQHGLTRALYINGHPRNWGYAAPTDELRTIITKLTHEVGK
jgi:GNAT superfamily N-acetyltransferase